MLAKLTLTIEQSVIEQAKEYAQKKNRSVSRIVEKYLKNIVSYHDIGTSFSTLKSPITDSISGMFHDNGKSYSDMLKRSITGQICMIKKVFIDTDVILDVALARDPF